MSSIVAHVLALVLALIAGWAVPALAARTLVPTLRDSSLATTNYRGRRIVTGLGLVWAVWAVTLLVAGAALSVAGEFVSASYGTMEMYLLNGPLSLGVYGVPVILTLGALVFGMADDVYGTHADKGFGGHLRALRHGRLTTGGLKLLGIGFLALVYAWEGTSLTPVSAFTSGTIGRLVSWLLGALVIALSANLVNLTDLRPGRALKVYTLLVVPAAIVFVLSAVGRFAAFLGEANTWTATDTVVSVVGMLVVLLGPVVAVWRFDLGEQAMLGDAGANAMGAIVGYLLAGSLPFGWLLAVGAALLALNLLSERVSYSRVIESNGLLRTLDRLGRMTDDPTEPDAESGEGAEHG